MLVKRRGGVSIWLKASYTKIKFLDKLLKAPIMVLSKFDKELIFYQSEIPLLQFSKIGDSKTT